MKLSKFLMLGAFTIATQASALPNRADDAEFKSRIDANLSSIIQAQIDKGFLTERASIEVRIVPLRKLEVEAVDENGAKIIDPVSGEVKKEEVEHANLKDTHFKRENGECKITLSFDEKGGHYYFGEDQALKKLTTLKTEAQKEMMRQFISLHEHYHCEFSKIDSPIQIVGKDAEFHQKLNYYMKDIIPIMSGETGFSSYVDTLSENFSDVAAKVSLIKQYGKDNKDLQYVFKAIEAQRHDAYFHNAVDSHFSHFSLQDLATPQNQKQIEHIQTGEDLKIFALDIANKGTQKMLAHKIDVSNRMFSNHAFQLSLILNTIRLVKDKLLPEQMFGSPYASNVARGFTHALAQEVVATMDLKEVPNPSNAVEIFQYAESAVNTTLETAGTQPKVGEYLAVAKEFQRHINAQHRQKLVDFDNPKVNEEVQDRIRQIRQNFMQATSSINEALKNK